MNGFNDANDRSVKLPICDLHDKKKLNRLLQWKNFLLDRHKIRSAHGRGLVVDTFSLLIWRSWV